VRVGLEMFSLEDVLCVWVGLETFFLLSLSLSLTYLELFRDFRSLLAYAHPCVVIGDRQ